MTAFCIEFNWSYIETRVKSQHDHCLILIFHHQATVSPEFSSFLCLLELLNNIHFITVSTSSGEAAEKRNSDVSTCQTIGASLSLLVLRATRKPPLGDHTLRSPQACRKYTNSLFLCVTPSTWVIRVYTFCVLHLFLQSSHFVQPNLFKPTSICNNKELQRWKSTVLL